MIVGERGAANEQWRFQCDDRRRRPLKTALYRRIEDKRRHHKDKGVRRVTLHDATLTISNDQSPYFHSSPFPLPVAVPGACRLARIPAMGAQASSTDVLIHIRVAYPTYVSRCLTLRAQCLTFMQIGRFQN
ncbi:hypothetical protein T06_10184 [Trichinella sp. T6]|nr:hypothetical protein T06_10184 [Trichinella sp. T6]